MTCARPLYAAVWDPANANLTWSDDYRGTGAATLATLVEQHGRQAARPALVALAADGRLWALFVDDAIGPWTLRVGMTAAQYEAELAAQVARGAYPIRLQAGGIGGGARFAAIFARGDAPLARAFTVATPRAGGPLDGLDQAMAAALRELNAHSAALAIARDGRLIFARGYTWAAPGYPQRMKANGTFRIASCSKLVTAIAIRRLIAAGRLAPETRAQDVLGLRGVTGGPPEDPRWGAITIAQLLTHRGGWDAGRSGDPLFDDATVLAAFPGARYPVTRAQIAAYMASRPLDFDPGTARAYSNFGYMLLGMVVDRLAGDYEGYVRGQILAPLGIHTARLGRSRYEERDAAREALYDEADVLWVSPSVVQPDRPPVAEPYGTYNHENLYAAGAWVFSAPALLKLLAAEYGGARNPPRTGGDPGALATEMALGGWDTAQAVEGGVIEAGKVGLLPGTVAALTHRGDDVSVCLFFSMWRPAGGAPAQAPQRIRDALARMGGGGAAWPTTDLFPALLE